MSEIARGVGRGLRTRVGVIGGLAALSVGAVGGGLRGCSTENVTTLLHAGKGTITKLELTPGIYCNTQFTTQVEGITAKHKRKLSFQPDQWVQETMSGPIEAKVCVKTKKITEATFATADDPKGRYKKGDYVLSLMMSANPSKSDVQLITYPVDPTKIKYKPKSNWAYKANDVLTNSANLASLGTLNISAGDGVEANLQALDQLQAFNIVSKKCGLTAITLINRKGRAGGTMDSQMKSDMLTGALQRQGHVDISPTSIQILYNSDGTGLPDQYEAARQEIQHKDKNFEFPDAAHMPTCGITEGTA